MRNPIVSPRFDEEQYKGQDVVHRGVRIPLKGYMPLDLLVKFSRRAQRIIKLPAQDNTGIKYRDMKEKDLPGLRAMWFDPEDKTFPSDMFGHVGVVAELEGRLLGGAVWTRQGRNLFLHQLVAGEEGKDLQIPTLLIWQSVIKFHKTGVHALDIGVSYNPKRYEFFSNFAVETYPIILKKPFYVPVIRLSPFRSFEEPKQKPDVIPDGLITFLPRGGYALYAGLKHVGVDVGDEVVIVKTFSGDFISGCVTAQVERLGARWLLRPPVLDSNTRAIVAVHEFGVPVFEESDLALIARAHELGIPVIEDCAWRSSKVWKDSEYAVFSAQKMLNFNYGGFLVGANIPDETLWSWGCLDVVKREKMLWEEEQDEGEIERLRNWTHYHNLVVEDGMMPDDSYDYAGAASTREWIPTVYMQRFETPEIADAIVARLEDFGIQAGRYWGRPVVYLPIHQNMSAAEVEYMFAVVRGYFNLCRDFKG